LTDLRRERAIYLVQHTNVPLKRIAAELGFNSDASFCMAFKSWVGEAPKRYRTKASWRAQANDAASLKNVRAC
jgi:AraC-like DNA-binding protein